MEAASEEKIIVHGRQCVFRTHGNAVGIWNSHDRLDLRGNWVHWAKAGSNGFFSTEADAREFARKHADRPVEPRPTADVLSLTCQQCGNVVMLNPRGVLDACPECLPLPAPNELADLRAEVERLREDSTDRDKAWQEKISEIVANARKQVDTLTAKLAAAEADTRRLDWLERQHVEVREPLRHGSRKLFLSAPEYDEESTWEAVSDLRSQIDSALAAKGTTDAT